MRDNLCTHRQISTLCACLKRLLHAGIPPGDALMLMARDEQEKSFCVLLETMARRMDEGQSLAAVLRQANCFPEYVCTMTAVGEQTGQLEEALEALAQYYEQRERFDHQLKAVLLGPLVLLGILLAVIVVLLVWVLPVFQDVYRQLGSGLTGVAGALLRLGEFLHVAMPVLLPPATAGAGVLLWLSVSPRARGQLLALVQKKWGGRGILREVNAAQLIGTLAMAVQSGMDSERALALVCETQRQQGGFETQCHTCLTLLRGDASLPQALRESGLLSASDSRLLQAGYQSGCADSVLAELGRKGMERSYAHMDDWLGRVEPALVLTASVLVGAILLCVLIPLTRIMSAIG